MSIIKTDFSDAAFTIAFGTDTICLATAGLSSSYTISQLLNATDISEFELPSTHLFDPSNAFQPNLLELVYDSGKGAFTNLTATFWYDYKIAVSSSTTLDIDKGMINSYYVKPLPNCIRFNCVFLTRVRFYSQEQQRLSEADISTNFTLNYTLTNYKDEELKAIVDLSSSPKLLPRVISAFVSSNATLNELIDVTIVIFTSALQ